MNSFQRDENNEELLLSTHDDQVMMEWEKPYMEASIDFLAPKGHVLEIGFGLGYSATQILKHNPLSYTVIECDPNVIESAKQWKQKYPDSLPARGPAFTGLANARPETQALSKPSVNMKDLPFDPLQYLEYDPPFDSNGDPDWSG